MIARTPPGLLLNRRRFNFFERGPAFLGKLKTSTRESMSYAWAGSLKLKCTRFSDLPKDFDFCAAPQGTAIAFESLGLALCRCPAKDGVESGEFEEVLTPRPPTRLNLIPHASAAARPSTNESGLRSWGLEETGVFDTTFTGNGIKVCVVDTGIDFLHPDLAHVDKEHRRSFVGDLTAIDSRGHGTRCAGIIGGPERPQNEPRYSVAPGVELFVARVFGGIEPCIVRLIAALEWAVSNKCAVVSMSIGNDASSSGRAVSAELEMAAAAALDKGTLVVAGAGNNSNRAMHSVFPVNHPASCKSIIAVGAVEQDLSVANYSNGPKDTDGPEVPQVDIAGPGTARSATKDGGYETKSGTSIATPFVAGIAALYAEACPGTRGKALRDLVLAKAKPLDKRDALAVGHGLVFAPRRDDAKLCEPTPG